LLLFSLVAAPGKISVIAINSHQPLAAWVGDFSTRRSRVTQVLRLRRGLPITEKKTFPAPPLRMTDYKKASGVLKETSAKVWFLSRRDKGSVAGGKASPRATPPEARKKARGILKGCEELRDPRGHAATSETR
jgi:hypothetical protein